jgi:hypothetical protein
MPLTEPIIIALITVTTGIAVVKGKKSGFLVAGAILSWILVFFYVFFDPTNVVTWINGNPVAVQDVEVLLIISMIMVEIAGLYFLWRS